MSSLSDTPREIVPEEEEREGAKAFKDTPLHLSYYQKTFATLIKSVIECYSPIFLPSELDLVKKILNLEDDSEKLLIRLVF